MRKYLSKLSQLADEVDERGVPTVKTGDGHLGQLHLFGYCMIVGAIAFISTGSSVRGILKGNQQYLLDRVLVYLIPFFLIVVAAGLWCLRFFWETRKLLPASKVCSKLGVRDRDLQLLSEERGILPCCNIDGQDYYDPADFKDAATLLRPSAQPTAVPETLLRPATQTDTPSEQLLRATRED